MYSRLPVPLVFRQSHDTDSHELDTYGSGRVDPKRVWYPEGMEGLPTSSGPTSCSISKLCV